MPIEIASTTDSEEQVTAAIGGKVEEPVKDEQKSASPDQNQDDETLKGDEESEASEKDSDEQDESEAQEDEGEDKKPKKLGNVQKRINKLTKKLSAKDQEIEYWKKAALARGESEKTEPQKETLKADISKKPSADDFEDHADYVEALADWKVDQKLKSHQESQRQAQVQAKEQEKARTFGQKLKEFSNKHDDFDELVDGVNDVLISPFVQQGIVESDYGPEIMYELAKDREEYERISSLSDAAAIRELGKIELRIIERLESKTKKQTSKTTNAPEPITPIKGRSASAKSKTIFDEDISQAEYERLRDGA